ncbi:hypothetical protein [Streptomyces sp. NPDC006134]|uniref:hypothetical protein n=1 Tax=Streptomyces sp. NPDC006134 TaxID=3154467 RepID=UPI0033EE79F1
MSTLAVTGALVWTSSGAPGSPDASHRVAAENVADESKWPRPTPERGLAKGLTLPVEKYLVAYPEGVKWQQAQRALWVGCMARYGFTDFRPPVPGTHPPGHYNDANMARRYGISDETQAARYGYHLPPEQAAEPPVWEPAPGAEQAVFTGEGPESADGTYNGKALPEGGCRGETSRKLGPAPQSPVASDAEITALQQSMKDAKVQAAIAAWSACMKDKGHSVAHPYDPPEQVDMAAATASEEEIGLAVDDVACKKETSLIQVWHKVESDAQQVEITKRRTALDAELSKKNTTVLKAQRALSGE